MDIIPKDAVESLAAALHEPDFEMHIPWQRVEEGLDRSFPVVGSKYRLLEFFQKKIRIGYIEGLEVCTVLIDENEPQSCEDQFSFSFECAHTVYFEMKLDATTPENEMLTRDSKWFALRCHWRIKSHL